MNELNIPNHVAIIVDGNGRWAEERGLNRSKGHDEGLKNLKKISDYILTKGVKYLSVYCFSTENVRKQFRKIATGTSVYGISRENIKKIKILVPPLKEQEKIAEILSTVDSQIDDTEKLIEKSKELKKGLMQNFVYFFR